MVLLLKLFSLFLLLVASSSWAANVTVSNRKILVDGKEFFVKGVCYSPTPVGKNVSSGYSWWEHDNYISDFKLIARMGANTIRTYLPEASTEQRTRQVLDEAYANGLYVIPGKYVTPDLSNIDNEIDEFIG